MPQRILVHDYSGHPFQPQLSRRLAARGHEVLHVYSKSVQIPQGAVNRHGADAPTLHFSGIQLGGVINKQAYLRRYFQERAYGRLLHKEIRAFKPDVVISSSTPLDAQASALKASRSIGARFVFWLQDLQGIAIERLLGKKLNGVGRMVGRYYTEIENRLLRQSDAVVSITSDFGNALHACGVRPEGIHVIPNWASMEELPRRPKDNPWSRAQGLADKTCFLYSGTLGLKHNPELLLQLALQYRDRADIAVVVVSEGAKADWLKEQKANLELPSLRVLPFQPYAQVPDMMGAADVLVAVLDPDAGTFSVPSKVLAYHCAGRAILLSVPKENLAARIVAESRTGLIAEPDDVGGFLRSAEELRASPKLREQCSENALHYARRVFDLDRITDRFESLFESLVSRPTPELEPDEEVAHERA